MCDDKDLNKRCGERVMYVNKEVQKYAVHSNVSAIRRIMMGGVITIEYFLLPQSTVLLSMIMRVWKRIGLIWLSKTLMKHILSSNSCSPDFHKALQTWNEKTLYVLGYFGIIWKQWMYLYNMGIRTPLVVCLSLGPQKGLVEVIMNTKVNFVRCFLMVICLGGISKSDVEMIEWAWDAAC